MSENLKKFLFLSKSSLYSSYCKQPKLKVKLRCITSTKRKFLYQTASTALRYLPVSSMMRKTCIDVKIIRNMAMSIFQGNRSAHVNIIRFCGLTKVLIFLNWTQHDLELEWHAGIASLTL
jgi:hypothetical protein